MDGTPLHAAKTAEEAARLIGGGASVHARNTRDETPLHQVANAGVARVLIDAGAEVDARGVVDRTPLHWAAQAGRADVVRALLDAGAEVDATDEQEGRPLHLAAWSGNVEAVGALLDAGADPHARDGGGSTPLHTAKGAHRQDAADLLRRAMEQTPPRSDAGGKLQGILKICVHPARREALTIGRHAILTRWTLDGTPRPLVQVQLTLARINDIATDGETVALATSGETIELRRWDDLSPFADIELKRKFVGDASAVAFSPDGRWLAAAPGGETIVLIDRATGQPVGSMEGGLGVPSLAFDPSSRLLASTHCDQGGGGVSIERIEPDGGLTYARSLDDEPDDSAIAFPVKVAFSPDGLRLAVTVNRTTWAAVALFEVESGRRLWGMAFDLRKPADRKDWRKASLFSGAIAFADDRTLAIGTPRGLVLLYDVESGKRVGRVRAHAEAPIIDLAKDFDRPIVWAVLGHLGGMLVPVPIDRR